MHITAIKIRNLGNIEYFETTLDRVNVLLGANAVGKTNVLRVFRWLFNGGNDPALLKDGCDEGWGEFTFSNGYKAHKRLWLREAGDIGYELKVLTPEGGEKNGAKTLLDTWLPKQSFDADEFLKQPSRKRVDFLLQHVDMTFTRAEVEKALNPTREGPKVIAMTERARKWLAEERNKKISAPAPPIAKAVLTLADFEEVYGLRYSQRTELKRLRDQIDGSVKTLEAGGLDQPDTTDWSQQRSDLTMQISKVNGNIAIVRSTITLESERAVTAERTTTANRLSDLKAIISSYTATAAAFSAAVKNYAVSEGANDPVPSIADSLALLAKNAELFSAAVIMIKGVKEDLQRFLLDEQSALQKRIEVETAKLSEDCQALNVQLAIAEEKAAQQQKLRGVMDAIAEQREQLAALDYTEEDITRSLNALARLKTSKLQALNIPGFDIKYSGQEPRIFINGRDFDRLNEQTQLFLACKFLRKANGELGFIICQSNAIATDNLEKLTEAAKEADVQFVLEHCHSGQPLRMIPAEAFLEASTAADAVMDERLKAL